VVHERRVGELGGNPVTDILSAQPGDAQQLRDLGWDEADISRHAPEPDDEPTGADSWRPVDLGPLLDGSYNPPVPTIGRRDDGVGLFYPGRIHALISEPEAGKTWFACMVSASEIAQGNEVVFIDFEDSAAGIVPRLLDLGVPAESIRERFVYIQPDAAPGLAGMVSLMEAITSRTSIVWIDGVTEAMSLYGLNPQVDTEVAAFGKRLMKPIAKTGPAVAVLDHVVKNQDSRGRWATGSQHKISGLNGAAYILTNVDRFGVGLKGRSRVSVSKDRPGQVRRHCVRTESVPGGWPFGDMVIDSRPGGVLAHLYPPPERAAAASADDGPRLPQEVMEKVSRLLEDAPEGLSKNAVETMLGGYVKKVRTAIELLDRAGFIAAKAGGVGKPTICHSVRPYRVGADTSATSAIPRLDLGADEADPTSATSAPL